MGSWLKEKVGLRVATASNAEGFSMVILIICAIILTLVPEPNQFLPFDIPGFRTLRNAISVFLVFLFLFVTLRNFAFIFQKSNTLPGRRLWLVVIPVLIWLGIVMDAFARGGSSAPSKAVLWGIVLLGLSSFQFGPQRPRIPSYIPAVLILIIVGSNWAYQVVNEMSYKTETDLRFAWFLAIIAFWLVPQTIERQSWRLFFLNHIASWIAFVFLLNSQLRSPSLLALILVSTQTFFWGLKVVDRIFLALLQFGVGILTWNEIIYRRIILDGKLYDSGRSEIVASVTQGSNDLGGNPTMSAIFGHGLGTARDASVAATGMSPHNILFELFWDFGLASLILILPIVGILLFESFAFSGPKKASTIAIFRLLFLSCFALLGLFNSILDEPIVVMAALIVLFADTSPRSVDEEKRPPNFLYFPTTDR